MMSPGHERKHVKAIAALKELPHELPPEPDWLQKRRNLAKETSQALAFPSSRSEEWRYTDLKALGLAIADPTQVYSPQEFSVSWNQASRQADPLAGNPLSWAATLAFVEGRLLHEERLPVVSSQKVVVKSLKSAMHEYGDLIREALEDSKPPADKFLAWHEAFWQDGLFVYVPPHTQVDLPLRVLSIRSGETPVLFPKTVIVVGRGAKVTVVEEYRSALAEAREQAQNPLSSASVSIQLKEGAELHYLQYQNWDSKTFHRLHQKVVLHKDAKFLGVTLSFGSRATKATIESHLDGPGAESRLTGLVFGSSDQHLDHHVGQIHNAGQTTSNLLFKSALQGNGRSVFTGLIRVEPGAQKTDAYQSSRNLLLSGESRADAIPKLEIETDDVRCTHGASIGTVAEDELFYLMSRGLDRPASQRLIVQGFFEEALGRLPEGALRTHSETLAHEMLEAKLIT